MGLCGLSMQNTHAKSNIGTERLHSSLPIGYPSQTNFPPITGMRNIITRPTSVRQPLKSLNRLTIPHSVAPSRDNNYRIWFQKHGPEHLVANGRYCNDLPEGVHLDQFEKQIPKSTACLP